MTTDRQAKRRRIREAAAFRALDNYLTFRCRSLADDLDDLAHQLCCGEAPGGCGCLCMCHDVAAATVIVKEPQL